MRNLSYFAWRTGRDAACLQDIVPPQFSGITQCNGHSAYEAFITSPAHAGKSNWPAASPMRGASFLKPVPKVKAPVGARTDAATLPDRRKITRSPGRPRLCVFLRDGRVRIDNNLTEPKRSGDSQPKAARRVSAAKQTAIRPSAIGKKNWLFLGDAQSGERAATFYTLIDHCHRLGIDATAYLTDLFTRLPRATNQTVHRLTPKAWAAEQAA